MPGKGWVCCESPQQVGDSSDGVQMLPTAAKDVELTGLNWEGSTCWLWLLWEKPKGFGEASLRAGSVNCHHLCFSWSCWHLRPLLGTGSVLVPGHREFLTLIS